MTLTKAKIVEALFAKNIFTKTESAQIIDTLFELMKQSLQKGEDVLASGFGKFSVKEKYQRIGRDPQTGERSSLRCTSGLGKSVSCMCEPESRRSSQRILYGQAIGHHNDPFLS